MSEADDKGAAAERMKPEEWNISVGALNTEVDVDGMATLENSNGRFDANSEDSTCDPDGTRGGDEAAPASDAPEARNADGGESDSENPDTGSTPDLQSKSTAKCRAGRRRTSKYCGVCSANRRNQWQARILMHGKVTHLGYFDTEEEAARVYDIVSLSLHREKANTNFPLNDYTSGEYAQRASKLCGLSREDLQRSLGVKPINKTSRYNGVSKKRGKWVAKVMIDKKLVYHASFDDEKEAALAYDSAVRRLKPNKAHAYVNFVEPSSADAANMNQSYVTSRQQQFVPGQQQRALQAQPMIMMSRNGAEAPMSGTTPVNHWPQLLGRMPFHPMPSHGPEPTMMMQQHPMAGQQVMYEQASHEMQNPHAASALPNGQIVQGIPSVHQQARMAPLQQTAMDGPEHGVQDCYGGMEQQMPNTTNQWPAWRAMPQVNGSMGPHMTRPDEMMRAHGMASQMPHPSSQRPVMWDGPMAMMKMPPMDAANRREPIRSHIQGLVPGSNMESVMNDRQQSSGSTWSSQFSVNPNLADEVASSTMGNRGFMPGGW